MNTIIRESNPTARKTYECNACLWLCQSLDSGYSLAELGVTMTEARAIVKARRNKWCIQPGERYSKQVGIFDGEFCTVRSIPAIDAICHRCDLYPEW